MGTPTGVNIRMRVHAAAASSSHPSGKRRVRSSESTRYEQQEKVQTKASVATKRHYARTWVPRPADLGAALPTHGYMRRKRRQAVHCEACARTTYAAVTTTLSALYRPLLSFDHERQEERVLSEEAPALRLGGCV